MEFSHLSLHYLHLCFPYYNVSKCFLLKRLIGTYFLLQLAFKSLKPEPTESAASALYYISNLCFCPVLVSDGFPFKRTWQLQFDSVVDSQTMSINLYGDRKLFSL